MSHTVVFAFGRMNPPTVGHQRLISKVADISKRYDCYHTVYLSHTQNSKTDPLEWHFKRTICEAAFPGINFSNNKNIKTPFQALEELSNRYSSAIFVAGSDRISEFKSRMSPYATQWGIDIRFISAGNRITESVDAVAGISSTKMRNYVREGNRMQFFQGLPSTLPEPLKILVYENVKKSLNNI